MGSGRKLGHEDRILWGKVARTVRPLHEPFPEEEIFLEVPESGSGSIAAQASGIAESRPSPARQTRQPSGIHHPLEKPVKRKLARGRLPIEARIDLHGMVQSEAHAVLRDFLIRAHERGMRHVLVITGKGNSWGSEGALKRAVPLWFARPDFRYLISSWEDAARNHGGDGALYIRLARRPGDTAGGGE